MAKADFRLAESVIEAHDYSVEGLDWMEPEDDSTNHFFTWGYVNYGRWEIIDSAGWVAELEPVVDENDEVIDYKVVEIVQVD